MPPIEAGQSFVNLAAFKNALREWAIERNWTPHILDSDSHRVRAGCRSSPDCPFRIRANYSAKRADARVTTVDDVHNCEPFTRDGPSHQNIKRAETGKLKFLVEAVPKLMNVTVDTSIHDIIATVEQKYGQKIPTRQAQKVKGSLVTRVKGPCRHCHRMGHTRRYCPQLRDSAPGPIDFSTNNAMDFSRNGQGEGNYAGAGLDDTFGEGDTMEYDNERTEQANVFHQNPRPQVNIDFDHTTQNGIDPNLSADIQPPYNASPMPAGIATTQPPALPATQTTPQQPRQSISEGTSNPIHKNTTQLNHETSQESAGSQPAANAPRTAGEVRKEASRLMQQASVLMQQASQMQADASRLLSSVADAS